MRKKRSRAKIDPELLRQMEAATADKGLVQAVFTLRCNTRKGIPPEKVEAVTRELLDRVALRVGASAKDVNVFRNLGAFAVSAQAHFIRALLTEPEIASGTANLQPNRMMIIPRKKKTVS